MLEFPVNVSKSDTGDYIARLADLPDGPTGTGVDPYAALDDLTSKAHEALSTLHGDGKLPTPTPVDDRPVITFDEHSAPPYTGTPMPLATGQGDQAEMIGYTWTNHTVFVDNLGTTK